METSDPAGAIRSAAAAYIGGRGGVEELWSAFHANLYGLCEDDGPLHGDFLAMFQALEAWEEAVPQRKAEAEADLQAVATRLAVEA